MHRQARDGHLALTALPRVAGKLGGKALIRIIKHTLLGATVYLAVSVDDKVKGLRLQCIDMEVRPRVC